MKRFMNHALKHAVTLFFICCGIVAMAQQPLQAQQQKQKNPSRTTSISLPPPFADSVAAIYVQFSSGLDRSGAPSNVYITSAAARDIMSQYGIVDANVQLTYPTFDPSQRLQQNSLGDWYASPDYSLHVTIVLPFGVIADNVAAAFRSLPEVIVATPKQKPIITNEY